MAKSPIGRISAYATGVIALLILVGGGNAEQTESEGREQQMGHSEREIGAGLEFGEKSEEYKLRDSALGKGDVEELGAGNCNAKHVVSFYLETKTNGLQGCDGVMYFGRFVNQSSSKVYVCYREEKTKGGGWTNTWGALLGPGEATVFWMGSKCDRTGRIQYNAKYERDGCGSPPCNPSGQ